MQAYSEVNIELDIFFIILYLKLLFFLTYRSLGIVSFIVKIFQVFIEIICMFMQLPK